MTTREDGSVTRVPYHVLLRDRQFLLVILISFTGGLGISAIPVALPAIADTLVVTDERVGLVITAFALPGIVLIPVVGVLADIYGRRPVILWALAIFGLSGLATFFVPSFEALLAVCFFQGAAFVGTLPISTTVVGDLYQGSTGVAAQGIRASVNGIARIVAPGVAGVLVGIAWYVPFGTLLFSFPVLVLVFLFFAEPVSLPSDDVETQILSQLSQYWTGFRAEASNFTFLLLTVGGAMNLFVRQAILVFIPLFAVRELGISLLATGLILSGYGGSRAITSPFAGELDAAIGRKWTLVLALGLMGLGAGLLPVSSGALSVAGFVALFGVGEAVFIPSFNDSMAAYASDDRRGGIIGSIQSIKNVGRATGPTFFGLMLAALGFPAVFLSAAVVALLYAVAVGVFFTNG